MAVQNKLFIFIQILYEGRKNKRYLHFSTLVCTFVINKLIMLLLLFTNLVVSTSLLAWVVLSFTGISLLHYSRYNKKVILKTLIALVLSLVSFYNSCYEGLLLFKNIALIPSLNSLAFTLLTPLFYLEFRFQITNRLPNMQQWSRHLFLPALLTCIYIGMTLFNPIPDKLIYSWQEFILYRTAWWIYFRLGCYLILIIQLFIYLPMISNVIKNKNVLHVEFIKKELLYLSFLYIISLITQFTSNIIFNIIYNITILLIGGYLLIESILYQTIKRRIALYLLPNMLHKNKTKQMDVEETLISINRTKEDEEDDAVIRLLKSPTFLYNPDLTLRLLARELGMNATSLSQYFSQKKGVRFPEYVTSLRLNEAERLLIESDRKVIEISELVGFQTPSTFYIAFNARHHIPPSQWRKKMKDDSL